MPKIIWSVVCYRGVVEAETGKISLLDIPEALRLPEEAVAQLEALGSKEVVVIPLRWNHVSWWQRSRRDKGEEFHVRHRIRDAKGRDLQEPFVLYADLRQATKARTILRSGALPLRGLGVYEFSVEVSADQKRWRKLASVPFEVTREEAPE